MTACSHLLLPDDDPPGLTAPPILLPPFGSCICLLRVDSCFFVYSLFSPRSLGRGSCSLSMFDSDSRRLVSMLTLVTFWSCSGLNSSVFFYFLRRLRDLSRSVSFCRISLKVPSLDGKDFPTYCIPFFFGVGMVACDHSKRPLSNESIVRKSEGTERRMERFLISRQHTPINANENFRRRELGKKQCFSCSHLPELLRVLDLLEKDAVLLNARGVEGVGRGANRYH